MEPKLTVIAPSDVVVNEYQTSSAYQFPEQTEIGTVEPVAFTVVPETGIAEALSDAMVSSTALEQLSFDGLNF